MGLLRSEQCSQEACPGFGLVMMMNCICAVRLDYPSLRRLMVPCRSLPHAMWDLGNGTDLCAMHKYIGSALNAIQVVDVFCILIRGAYVQVQPDDGV